MSLLRKVAYSIIIDKAGLNIKNGLILPENLRI